LTFDLHELPPRDFYSADSESDGVSETLRKLDDVARDKARPLPSGHANGSHLDANYDRDIAESLDQCVSVVGVVHG
jgi:hypothetical protein